jgi:diaminopimelate epimerase
MSLRFTKMHGAGNDFVVVDRRTTPIDIDVSLARAMGDRHTGVGFDQLLAIEDSPRGDCIAAYRIWNTDGSEALQCGNGVRCIAAWLQRDGAVVGGALRLHGPAGVVDCTLEPDGRVRVDMGVPRFAPAEVPFEADGDRPSHEVNVGGRKVAIGVVSMGNPHAVLDVDDVEAVTIPMLGESIGRHPRFPQGCNVGFAQVMSSDAIRLRVIERGVGETLACGTGACAAVAVLRRSGRVGPRVAVTLPGGTLDIAWPGEGSMLTKTGPAAFVYEGEWLP